MDDDSAWRSRPPDRELAALVDGAVHLPTGCGPGWRPVDRSRVEDLAQTTFSAGVAIPAAYLREDAHPGTAWPA